MLIGISGLRVNYGHIVALDGIDIELRKGEIVSIVGANGAGKSSLLRTIAGLERPAAGSIVYKEREIARERPDRIVALGISLVPEGRRIFPDMSVKENLEVGAHTVTNRRLRHELFEMVCGTFPRLRERLGQHAGTLSGGEQQMLALGRALMGNPEVLLLDEPSMGLSPIMTKEIFVLICTINKDRGISILLVEQNAHMALDSSARAYVLENGRVSMEGVSSELKCNEVVVDAYLGFDMPQ